MNYPVWVLGTQLSASVRAVILLASEPSLALLLKVSSHISRTFTLPLMALMHYDEKKPLVHFENVSNNSK